MEGGFILLFAALALSVAPVVKVSGQLSYANGTQVAITRTGCGDSKLCVETPANCDPAASDCLFVSFVATTPVAPNGLNLSIQLSGKSEGYIALGLTKDASEGNTMLFVCAQNASENGTFFFRTLNKNNTSNAVTDRNITVTEIRGLVESNVIKCEFDVPSVNASNANSMGRNAPDSAFEVVLATGKLNGADLGPLKEVLKSGPLNLADPAANTKNTTTTTATPTTAGANSVLQSYALLLLLSVATLSVTQRA